MARLTSNDLSRRNPYWMPRTIALHLYYHCLSYNYLTEQEQELIRGTAAGLVSDPDVSNAIFQAVIQERKFKDFHLSEKMTCKEFNQLLRKYYYVLAKRGKII